MKLDRICPICNCEKGESLYEINFAKADDEYIPEHYDIVACENCGFIFNNTKWTQKDYDKYYAESKKYSSNFLAGSGGLSELDKIRYNNIIDRLERIIDKDSSIVDIGCAKGGLLRTLKDRGYNNLYGIESSNEAIANLKKYSIDGMSCSIFDILNINKKFDVVILSQVLEHIYDLKKIKHIINNILNKNGILYIDVPNANEYYKYLIKPFHYFDIDHINHFNLKSLYNLFLEYECIEVKSYNELIIDNKKYPIIYSIFRKCSNKYGIIRYIEKSYQVEKENYFYNIDPSKKTFLWGYGSYLKRLLLNETYFNNIDYFGIIDKNKTLAGMKIYDYKNNEIEIFTPEILNKYNDANIIITSSLYSSQIRDELLNNKNFIGKIAEQSRAEQSRAELIFSYYYKEAV